MIENSSKYRFNFSFLFWFILLTLNFLFIFIVNSLAATQVSLMWDPNSEPDLAGYKVFCREQGQNYDYANPSWEGTDTSCTIFNLDETQTYCFVTRAFNTQGFESENSNEVCHDPLVISNQPPNADAGPNQTVNEGQNVFLNGSNSTDPDDGIASVHWVQIGEPAVNLSDPNAEQPTFTAPDVRTEGAALTFELTVADYNGVQSKDSCVVNVTWQNEPPQANAGFDQTVNEENVVTLDGSYSLDIDDGIESYSWNQITGPTVVLSNPESCQPTFTAPNVESDGVSLAFKLTVTDSGGLQNTDSCIVNISRQNQPPTAVVTPDYMQTAGGALVTLDGSASTDSDDGIDSYLWSQVDGDPVSLSDPTSAITTFTAPKTEPLGKNIKFKLTVKDHGGLQGTADSFIYVMQNELPNNPPAVDFSYATKKKLVSFIDCSTDSDGTIVSWFWEFGDGNTSTEQNPSHRYQKIGNYIVTLSVTDDGWENNSIFKNITVTK
ncbi:MAG: PKD domain-containing protein [Desulfobacterales bacterium]|jgi:PKD repeat protein